MSDFFTGDTNYMLVPCAGRNGSTEFLNIIARKYDLETFTFWPTHIFSSIEERENKTEQLFKSINSNGNLVFKNYYAPYTKAIEEMPNTKKIFIYRRSLKDQLRSFAFAVSTDIWHFTESTWTPNLNVGRYDTLLPKVSANFVSFLDWLDYYTRIKESGEEHLLLCYEDLYLDPNKTLLKRLFGDNVDDYIESIKTPELLYSGATFEGEETYIPLFNQIIEKFSEKNIILTN
jgi:hypothetical protein